MRWQRGIIVLAAAALGLAATGASAAPVDLSAPGGELGAANARGFLEFWREVEGVGLELGKGSYLPLRYRFSTESDRAGALGAGFYVPMFEARNVLIREDTMLANLPCGKKLYLWRDPTDASKFQTPDREWKGSLAGDDFTLWRDDGWKVSYRQGRLASTISDDKRVTRWSYDAAGGGRVEQDGKPVVTMEPDGSGQAAGFTFAGKSYKAEYGKRPIMEAVGGQSVLKDLAPALSRLTFPDGRAQTFEFGLTDERTPKLTAGDGTGISTDYTWDAASRHIATERGVQGAWTYAVGEIAGKFVLPSLSRSNSQGMKESIAIDESSGTYTTQDQNGIKTITHVFEEAGPLYHKVRSIEQTFNGKTNLISKASYDENGRLIRSIDNRGFVTTYQYGSDGHCVGRQIALTTDKTFLASLSEVEQRLISRLDNAPIGQTRDRILNDLYIFYVGQALDYAKAEQLLKLMTNREQIYNLKLALATNPAYTKQHQHDLLVQLIEEFPEKKVYTGQHLIN